MSKHRRKHANRQKPTAVHGEVGQLSQVHVDEVSDYKAGASHSLAMDHETYIFGDNAGHIGVAMPHPSSAYDPGVAMAGSKAIFMEALIDSARHLGKFDEKIANRIRAGKQRILFIDVTVAIDYIDQTFKNYHPEPRRTPADGASVTMANARSEHVPAIPEPLYGARKQCSCGAKYWKLKNYQAHYAHEHIVLGEKPL